MDQKVVAWARAVKARQRGPRMPPLWLFTDPARMPDLLATIDGLPRGLCGVVFRHDRVPSRGALALAVARRCHARRLTLVVAGDWRLAARCRCGIHMRDGRGRRTRFLSTSSAHDGAACRRAARAGAAAVFLSPAFPTLSHEHARVLGPARWAAMAQPMRGTLRLMALGGINAATTRRLPTWCDGAGAIGALTNNVA